MASSKLHRSQMTAIERTLAREQRAASAGVRNLQGGTSYFTQGHGDATPTPEETLAAVQWARGVEQQPHQTFTFGPRFDEILEGVPDNEESAGPTPLHVGPRRA